MLRRTFVTAMAACGVSGGFEGEAAGTLKTVLGIRLRWCPAGRFRMGSPLTEPERRADERQVDVTLTRGFWMGETEVTQRQWKEFAGTALPRPLNKGVGDDVPVYWVNYADAERFCERLTARSRASREFDGDWEFRLPTEAQWEYACRAGTTTAFAFGETLQRSQANIDGTESVKVGSYRANAWGIHDMHGNVFEWVRDWYHSELPGGSDPDLSAVKGVLNRDGTISRARRGGAWTDAPKYCRSAMRLRYEPERNSDHIGFRVAAVPRV
jgi:formylglycine-generating enzyme